MQATDPDYYPASFANGVLDGGLKDELAFKRGYAYPRGVGSTLNAQLRSGTFKAHAQVQSNLNLESLRVIRDVVDLVRNDLSIEDIEGHKDVLLKSRAVNFEQPGTKLSMLDDIAFYGLSDDYVQQRGEFLRNLTKEEFQEAAQALVDPDRMIYVVVGDAASQLDSLREFGLGEPVVVTLGGG
jgi:zinc protease